MSDEARKLLESSLNDAALYDCDSAFVFEISGADTQRYLQGRITQDISNLSSGCLRETLLLSPQGKILSKLALLKREEDYLCFTFGYEEDDKPNLLRALFQFRVADQVDAVELQHFEVVALCGKNALQLASDTLLNGETLKPNTWAMSENDLIVSAAEKSEIPVVMLLGGYAAMASARSAFENLPQGSEEDYQFVRVRNGEPIFPNELNDKIIATDIPHRSLISFDKGCYAGQEVVEMSIARGKPNRRLVKVVSSGEAPLKTDAFVFAGEKKVGFITSSVGPVEDNSIRSLAFIKNGTDLNQELSCEGISLEIKDSLYDE